MIGSINAYTATHTGSTSAPVDVKASSASEGQNAADTQISSTQTISTLARQLADSASRAEARDKTLTRSELADKAKSILNRIVGDSYYANKALNDSEVPNTSDPELLTRAKQATAYVNDASRGGHSVKNPFSGLSREQLSNVIYDDSGTYTVNERHAAWRESYDQEEAWREKVCAQAMDEYNRTGKLTNFFSSVLDHFKGLPAIEQAQYPKDYASDLETKISRDFNYRTNQAEGKGEDPKSLIEMLFPSKQEVAGQKKTADPGVAKSTDSLPTTAQSTKSTGTAIDSPALSTTLPLSRAAQNAIQFQAKQLNDMQNALDKLRAMPSVKVSAKLSASQRAAMLKKQLDTLKQMMIGATPAQAKAMASQLKDIAKELASMGETLSGGNSAPAASTNAGIVATGVSGSDNSNTNSVSAQGTAIDQSAAADISSASAAGTDIASSTTATATNSPSPVSTGTEAKEGKEASRNDGISEATKLTAATQSGSSQNTGKAQGVQNAVSKNDMEKSANDALKAALEDARKALRSAISMLKSKLGGSNKDVKDAEHFLAKLDHSLTQTDNQDASVNSLMGSIVTDSGQADVSASTASVESIGGVDTSISVDSGGGAVGSSISVSA